MPLVDNTWYVDSVGWSAVTAWATGATLAAGVLRRQVSPTVLNERVFIVIVAGTTHATTEPTWVLTRGAKTTDNTITWQECSGLSGINGDITNTPSWAAMKAITSAGVLGQHIKNNAGTHLFIMSTAGTIGAAEPSFSTTTGATTVDNAATWTCIGAVGAFTGNQAPHARMFTVMSWASAGNDIYIKSSSAETTSSGYTLGGAGTAALPQRWLCHNGGAYPPAAANLTTGASITSTGASINLVINATAYIEGISFVTTAAGSIVNIGTTTALHQRYKNCTFTRGSTTGSILIGQAGSGVFGTYEFDNCTCSFASTGNVVGVNEGFVLWKNSTFFAGAAVPTNVFNFGLAASQVNFEMHGVDLSAAGSGKVLFPTVTTYAGLNRLVNCKLGASVTVAQTPSNPTHRIEIVNCDDGTKNYRNEVYDYYATLTTETTIVRTGGATDGATAVSWKIITTANAKFSYPFVSPPIAVWNDVTGSPKTATIEGIWGGGAVPTDGDIWVEVEYLGSSATPVASYISDAKATVLTTAANQSSSSATWGGSTTKFKLDVTFTPQMKGFVYARVKVGAASSTFYVDPVITLT